MWTDPPGADVIEVSLFGPGVGESVLVHLGRGNWIVVDCCVDRSDGSIPVLRYLEEIGVDYANSISMIVATHAHDDHTAGISTLVEKCPSAMFVCSAALTTEEFFKTIALDKKLELLIRQSAYSEYRKVFETVRRRSKSGQIAIRRATESRSLLSIAADDTNPAVNVIALSPSDHAVTRSIDALARHVAMQLGTRRRISSFDPNEASVVLWIEVGDKVMLLGADVLNGPANCGWEGVLSSFQPESDRRASLFKVAHHGSPGADHDDVWGRLVTDRPVALLTPYWRGSVRIPGVLDRGRILSRANAFITATPAPKSPKPVKSVAAQLGQSAQNVRPAYTRCGQIRARAQLGDPTWKIETFPPAKPLLAAALLQGFI
jgi:beta-lactamase superfamily II metal-dependent hydrolase